MSTSFATIPFELKITGYTNADGPDQAIMRGDIAVMVGSLIRWQPCEVLVKHVGDGFEIVSVTVNPPEEAE